MKFRACAVRTIVFVLMSAFPVSAQTATDELLRTLIREVHELRLALERSTLVGYRGQLLIEQLRTQNDRIAALRSDLDRVHDGITNAEAERTRLELLASNLADEVEKQFDASARAPMDRELGMVRARLGEIGRRNDALVQRESELQSRIRDTESRIDELQRKIDLLERSIEEASQPDRENR